MASTPQRGNGLPSPAQHWQNRVPDGAEVLRPRRGEISLLCGVFILMQPRGQQLLVALIVGDGVLCPEAV